MISFSKTKAQGTIEYLVILAVIINIALVVVSVLIGLLDNGGEVDEKSSKIYWSSQPVAIDDALADNNGGSQIVVKNNTDGQITLTNITANNVPNSINSGAGEVLAMSTKYVATLSGIPLCLQKKQTYTLTVNYLSKYTLPKQVGPKELVISCTDNVIITVSLGDEDEVTITATDGVAGALPVWDGSEWVFSADENKGISIDQNAVCFGGTCDQNIDWNGTDLIFNG